MSDLNRIAGVILGMVLCASLTARAGLEPCFIPDFCIEASTDIVVASQASTGEISVLEVWKGDLKKGDKLALSHLPAIPLAARSNPPGAAFGKLLDGVRIILFLKPSVDPSLHDRYTGAASTIWAGQILDETPTSAVWIHDAKAYAYEQMWNPGDSIPTAIETSERELKTRTLKILDSKEADVDAALAISDITQRIDALESLTSSRSSTVRREAFAALGNCGADAAEDLLEMCSVRTTDLDLLVDALAKAAGSKSDYQVDRILLSECRYWKDVARSLKVGWQIATNSDGSARYAGSLAQYRLLECALGKIDSWKHDDEYHVVAQIQPFWIETPQLNDWPDPEGVISRCNTRLESRDTGEPSTAP